jgi:hypothetical protein
MNILDKNHFYKIDGDMLATIESIASAVVSENYVEIFIQSGRLYELVKNYKIEAIK